MKQNISTSQMIFLHSAILQNIGFCSLAHCFIWISSCLERLISFDDKNSSCILGKLQPGYSRFLTHCKEHHCHVNATHMCFTFMLRFSAPITINITLTFTMFIIIYSFCQLILIKYLKYCADSPNLQRDYNYLHIFFYFNDTFTEKNRVRDLLQRLVHSPNGHSSWN